MSWLTAPLTTFCVFYFIYLIFELFVHRSERKMLIMKIGELGNVDLNKILSPHMNNLLLRIPKFNLDSGKNTALRIGLCVLGIGMGCLVGLGVCRLYGGGNIYNLTWEDRSLVITSCVCIFGGLALVMAYVIERKNKKDDMAEAIEKMEKRIQEMETEKKN